MALSGAIVRPFGVKDVFISFSNLPSAQDLQQAKNIAAHLAQFIRLQVEAERYHPDSNVHNVNWIYK